MAGACKLSCMTIGERLLSLTVEYQDVTSGKYADEWDPAPGRPVAEIAKDYEDAIRELLA